MASSLFDELTRSLATSTSRRRALRRIGGTLTGAIVASWPFGQALASGGGNSACAHFCAAVFGADTAAAGQCTSDAAHHTGLCYSCGPASAGGTQPVCCPQNPDGTCSSYSSTTCAISDACSVIVANCGTNNCGACIQSVEGGAYCSGFCGECATCASNSDCVTQFGEGFICAKASCCATGTVCLSATCATCGCFTGDTLIAMADGTSRQIKHVQSGDLVLGDGGRANRVAEVLLPVLGQRPLYSLNGSSFFVTSGHPFMTEEGWKAVDPAAVPTHLSVLHVGQLTVGDRLLALMGAAVPAGRAANVESIDVRIEAVALQSLVAQTADPATQLYNLQLDGDHTYFANDLLVHNK